MSTYQYYEFQAVDRSLTPGELDALRAISKRATITPTRFQNVYSYGDFGGDPLALMTDFFDAFVYVANWGTHKLMLRLPRADFEPSLAQPYAVEFSFDVHERDDVVILDFDSEGGDDEDYYWITDEEAAAWLPALLPLRAELARGDTRALYLGWLGAAFTHEEEDEVVEPPAPPGLGELSPALKTLASFLRISEDLLAIAAANSPALPAAPSDDDLRQWISRLPADEKDALLVALAADAPRAQADLTRRFHQEMSPPLPAHAGGRRLVQMLAAAEEHAKVRLRREAAEEAAEQARREREAAAAREAYLDSIAGKEEALWEQIPSLIAAMQAREYEQAVQLLTDLRDLAARHDRAGDFTARLAALRQEYAKRRGLMTRLDKAGLRA